MKTIEMKHWSVEEKLQAMDAIWSDLLKSQSGIDSPDWHTDVLAARQAKIDSGYARFISVEELSKHRD